MTWKQPVMTIQQRRSKSNGLHTRGKPRSDINWLQATSGDAERQRSQGPRKLLPVGTPEAGGREKLDWPTGGSNAECPYFTRTENPWNQSQMELMSTLNHVHGSDGRHRKAEA